MNRPCIATLVATLILGRCLVAENIPTLAVGAAAPDFNLPGVDGRNWALKDFADAKALVVVFTCDHCPTAQYYEERIKQIVADYKDKSVALVAISPNDPKSIRLDELGWTDLSDSFAEMKLRAKQREYNFPYLYDGDTEAVSRAYGPVANKKFIKRFQYLESESKKDGKVLSEMSLAEMDEYWERAKKL